MSKAFLRVSMLSEPEMNNKWGDGMTGGYFSPLGSVVVSLGATGCNFAVHEHTFLQDPSEQQRQKGLMGMLPL